MARRAEDLPPSVVVIEDEFSSMADEEYREALDRWLAELDAAPTTEVEISAVLLTGDRRLAATPTMPVPVLHLSRP